MRALTVHQPFAEWIACGWKRVENRSWSTTHRNPLAIHAGTTEPEPDSGAWQLARRLGYKPTGVALPRGVLVATVDVVDCHWPGPTCGAECDGWAEPNMWHWVLNHVRRLDPIVPWPGEPRLFHVPDERVFDAPALKQAWIPAVLYYIGRDAQTIEVNVDITYTAADPYAVTLTFLTRYGPVRWSMARDLLAEALELGHAGQGDVQFTPHPLREDMFQLELHSPTGHAQFELDYTTLQRVLNECEQCVPIGSEHLDWNRELAHLGVA